MDGELLAGGWDCRFRGKRQALEPPRTRSESSSVGL